MKIVFLFFAVCLSAALVFVVFRFVQNGGISPPTKLVTAEQVLAEIDGGYEEYYPSGNTIVELPPDELKIVVDTLRDRFPSQSLLQRLPGKTNAENPEPIALSDSAGRALKRVERQSSSYMTKRKINSLKKLHSTEVESFINREGFGFERRPPVGVSPKALEPRNAISIHRLAHFEPTSDHYGAAIDLQTGSGVDSRGLPKLETISGFHEMNQSLFASAESIGYVKDIENVVGFEPHQLMLSDKWNGSVFQPRVKPVNHDWRVNRVELLSLLLNDRPLIYVAEPGQLPTMENVKGRQTRELTEFESRGLESFSKGEDTYVSASINRIEMMGAIRASQNCLECHNGKRGRILGAFSYEILRAPVVKPAKPKQPGKDDFAFVPEKPLATWK